MIDSFPNLFLSEMITTLSTFLKTLSSKLGDPEERLDARDSWKAQSQNIALPVGHKKSNGRTVLNTGILGILKRSLGTLVPEEVFLPFTHI